MTEPQWASGRLRPVHELDEFDCGDEGLNDWLKSKAMRAQEANTARTYVWTRSDSPRVSAYYAIAPTQVVRAEVTAKLAGGFSTIPGYLLARLAVDRTLQNQRLGHELLHDALTRIVESSDRSGGRIIVVDALNERAASFYRKFDFVPISATGLRLAVKIATVRKSLGVNTLRVSSDPQIGLVSVETTRSDGSVVQMLSNPDEAHRVGNRLLELAAEGKPVSLRQVFIEVLGRDPFAR